MAITKSGYIYKSSSTDCVIIKMEAGDYLRPHSAPVSVMIILKQGTAEVTVNNSSSLLEAGEHILIAAGELHAVKAIVGMQFYLFKLG